MSNYIQIVSIEGNIGSGKSTLLEKLKEYYKENTNILFLREPVDEWEKIKDNEGNTMLQKFYADQEKYSFSFQMMAYISRLSILRETINKAKEIYENHIIDGIPMRYNKIIIITERCLYTDKYVFAKMLYDQGKIEDVNYKIYLHWFDEFAKDYTINNIIYVKTEPQNCYNRIHKRARQGEEIIPISYLQDCHKYHEEFLSEPNIYSEKLLIDGNENIFENDSIIKNWLEKINKFLRE